VTFWFQLDNGFWAGTSAALVSAVFQVVVGGLLVFATGVLIGSS
jgi:hypothetical protein